MPPQLSTLICSVRAQNAEGFRKRALEGIKVISYLKEFANAGSLAELSELFQDDNRLAEAAVGLLRAPSPAVLPAASSSFAAT